MARSRGLPVTAVVAAAAAGAAEGGVAVEAADGATALSHNTSTESSINLVRHSSLRF
jgi:hypothetical protein